MSARYEYAESHARKATAGSRAEVGGSLHESHTSYPALSTRPSDTCATELCSDWRDHHPGLVGPEHKPLLLLRTAFMMQLHAACEILRA